MRVCHIITRLILGGAQENTLLACAGLAARGHEVLLVTGNPAGSQGRDGELLAMARAGGYRVQIVPSLYRAIHPCADWRAYRDFRRILCKFHPDVVHTHTSKAGILGRQAAHRQGVPVVVHTIHGMSFNRTQPTPVRMFYRALERRAARQCQALIGVCQAMVTQSLQAGVGCREQYHVIYSGMELEGWEKKESEENIRESGDRVIGGSGDLKSEVVDSSNHQITRSPDHQIKTLAIGNRRSQNSELRTQNSELPNPQHPTADTCFIGTVARLFPNKGHDDLLALLDELHRRGRLAGPFSAQRPRLEFVWIGDGPLRPRLENELARRGLSEHVQLLGLVPREKLPEEMAKLDLVLHTSRWEGLPRALVQGLLSEAALIAWDIDGNPEVCQNAVTGHCVKLGDIRSLANAVEDLADHPALRRQYAEAGRAWCLPRFDAAVMVERLEKLYGLLLKERR